MKICVLGAGSLGCAIGGALAEAGSEVWLVNRSRAHVDAINNLGLRVRDGAVVRWGERCNVPTPVNRTLVAGIKGREHRMLHGAAGRRS